MSYAAFKSNNRKYKLKKKLQISLSFAIFKLILKIYKMEYSDSDKEFSKVGSWIPIRSLKDATNIQSVYRQNSRSSSVDSASPIPSADTSITME